MQQYLPGKMFGPYSFINIPEGRELDADHINNKRNMFEVAALINILQRLHKGKCYNDLLDYVFKLCYTELATCICVLVLCSTI